MSIINNLFSTITGLFKKPTKHSNMPFEGDIYSEEGVVESVDEIHSIWDYLKFHEHTQAHHLVNVVGFDEWVSMEEIRRRVRELFSVEYKNERSLYPYIKTLVDIGLMETSNVGGKRKWRKKDLMIKIKVRKKKEAEEIEAKTKHIS
ncbi:MAG: hypothetical protein V1672_05685 [Candidatus Diapherotrites archaeon]